MGTADEHRADDRVHGLSLLDLARKSETSVRLGHCLQNADGDPESLNTVGQYLDAGGNAQSIMMRRVRNFGRKCAVELDFLVRNFISDGQIQSMVFAEVKPDLGAVARAKLTLFAAEFANVNFLDVFVGLIVPQRLWRVLKDHRWTELTLDVVILDAGAVERDLLKEPALGRTSIRDIRPICASFIRRYGKSQGVPDGMIDEGLELAFGTLPP